MQSEEGFEMAISEIESNLRDVDQGHNSRTSSESMEMYNICQELITLWSGSISFNYMTLLFWLVRRIQAVRGCEFYDLN
jgi:hypothetical protein